MSGFSAGLMTPIKRRVFFSFHYQNDIWRVNQIRQSWRYQHEQQREAAGFFDASLWERAKRTSPDSLKSLIRDGIANTSVTCVLAGAETYQRRWVRYEIARSIVKGNGLFTVRISNILDQKSARSIAGDDPLSHMGVYRVPDGRILLAERDINTGQWKRYDDYTQAVTLPAKWQKPIDTNVIILSTYATCYDYVHHNGRVNFGSWVRQAAESV